MFTETGKKQLNISKAIKITKYLDRTATVPKKLLKISINSIIF